MAPHTSRSATVGVNEARSSPILEPSVPASSSGFRQTPTPPLQSNQKPSSSPQHQDLNTSHLPRVIDRESLAPSAAHLPVTSCQPQVTGGEMPSNPSTASQASPARSVPSQVENGQAEVSQRSAERTLTSLAPPLTAVSSQSQSTPTSVRTTPSQSTSRSTKSSDAPSARQHDKHGPPVEQSSRQDALQVDLRNQPPAPGPQISSAADQHRTTLEPPRHVVIASTTESSSAGLTPPTAMPAVGTSPTMHPQSHAASSGDTPTRQEHVTHAHLAAGDVIQFPAVPSNHQGTHTYTILQPEHGTGRQLQPSSAEDARPPLEPAERFVSASGKGRDATIPGPNSHFSAASVVQAHTQGNAQSGGGHSRKNSIDVNATRPIMQHHTPTPPILVEDSPREVPRREAFPPVTANMPQPKSLPPEPILSATTSFSTPQITPTTQTTISRDVPDNEILPEPRSARLLNNVPLTAANVTSTSASSQLPTIGSGSSKSQALLDEDLPSPHAFSHKKQDSSVSRDAAEDTVLLRNQLRDEPSQVPAMVAPPVSHSAGVGQFRSSQDPTLDDASRTMPSRSWHQSAKQPERHSPRLPSVMDLPQSTITSAIKTEAPAVIAQQPVSARAVLQGSHSEDQGQLSGSFNNQRGGLLKTTSSAVKHVSQSANPDELRSPQPLNPVASTPVKGDLHSKENADDHKAVRQRDQDDTTGPPIAFEKQRGDTYRSASRAPPGVTPFAQDPPPRFPVVEDVMQRPSTTANRPERQKFSYGPASTPALDPHHNLLSPVQQAIRAAPPPQIQPRSLSHDTQTSDLRSRGQTDVLSAMSSQHVTSRSQPYSMPPIPASSVPPSQSSNSASMNIRQWTSSNSVNPYAPPRLDESITPQRTTQSSTYPPASRYPTATTYPTASNRSDSQPTATPNMQQPGPQNPFVTSASQQAARYAPSVQYSQSPPVPDIPQSNFLSRASDAVRKAPVNRVQANPEPHPPALSPTTFVQESTGTHRHNVSLTNVTSQLAATPHLPTQKSSSSSIKPPPPPPPPPPHPAPTAPPVSSSYYLRPDLQQPTVSTRVPVSGHSSTLAPSRSRLPSQPSRNTSKESILMTPSSLAPSMLPKTDHSRIPPMAPISRQESNQSKDSSKKKNGFLNIFRSKTPAQKTYEVWHPPALDKQRNQSQSSLQSTSGKVPVLASSSSTIDGVASTSQRKAPAPIAVNLPLHATGRKEPDQKVFSAFKFLHTKRNRTVSHASVEAQDGQTQTATNTVVGSPTQSNRSQPFAPPPVRDPQLAAQEWRNREEAEMRSRAKRRRPGVVFDMEEDPPEPPPGTVPKKKLARRRQ
ncbi:hypothetical protein PILCRDRAFT_515548 [Piloderma croceum F 1598]|uniref:Uncharacterized protein n=1 Tax=Piloderma croceum (strain F 1598) TaxID=765440 RepID=A0A0C3FNE3_PILCF|nr:hypothetical protein PILCRDRAFT_515548 [Piloderma croceum F 1598]